MRRTLAAALALLPAVALAQNPPQTINSPLTVNGTVTATTGAFGSLTTTGAATVGGTLTLTTGTTQVPNGGQFLLRDASGSNVALFLDSANGAASNYVRLQNGATGGTPTMRAFGTDASVSLRFTPQGPAGLNIFDTGITVNQNLTGIPVVSNFVNGTNFITGTDSTVVHNPNGVNYVQIAGNTGVQPWLANTAYGLNTQRNNGGNIYKVTTAGTSAGSGGPTGTGTGIVDNTIVWDFVASDFVGARTGLNIAMTIRSMNGPSTANDLERNWPAVLTTFSGSFNQGGTAPASGLSAGAGYGGADQSWLLSGATNWSAIVGREIDCGIFTGASAKSRLCLNLSSFGDLPAASDDQAIAFTGRTIGFKTLLRIGEVGMTATDAILQYFPRPQGALNGNTYINPVADRGIDLQNIAFTTAAFRAPGNGGIDGAGAVFSGAAKLSTSSTAVSLDAPGSIVTAVASLAAGTLFKAGDQLYDPAGSGTIITVNTVDGGGAPTAWTLTRAGGVLGATPGNPVTFSGGSGINSAFTLTWTRVGTLALNPSGGNTVVGTGSALATNATSGFLQVATTAGAPTGNCGGATGKACVVVDTTNKKWCYNITGTTWECSAAFTP